jgi:hypothetical protein
MPLVGYGVSAALVGPGVVIEEEGLGVCLFVGNKPGVVVGPGMGLELPEGMSSTLLGPGVAEGGSGVTKPFVGSGTLNGWRDSLTRVGTVNVLKLVGLVERLGVK